VYLFPVLGFHTAAMRIFTLSLSLLLTAGAFAQDAAAPAAAPAAASASVAPAPADPAAPAPAPADPATASPAAAPAAAPAVPHAPGGPLTVLIKPVKPFAFEENGEWVGFSVDLWKRVAQDSGLKFEFKPVKTAKDAIDGVNKREADVAVGALSVTAAR